MNISKCVCLKAMIYHWGGVQEIERYSDYFKYIAYIGDLPLKA
jgi:hypothetical protein